MSTMLAAAILTVAATTATAGAATASSSGTAAVTSTCDQAMGSWDIIYDGTCYNDFNVSYVATASWQTNITSYHAYYQLGSQWIEGSHSPQVLADGFYSPWKVFMFSMVSGTPELMLMTEDAAAMTHT